MNSFFYSLSFPVSYEYKIGFLLWISPFQIHISSLSAWLHYQSIGNLKGNYHSNILSHFPCMFYAYTLSQSKNTHFVSFKALRICHLITLLAHLHSPFFLSQVILIFPQNQLIQFHFILECSVHSHYFQFSLIYSRSIRIASAIPGLLIVFFLVVEATPFFNILIPFLLRILFLLFLIE